MTGPSFLHGRRFRLSLIARIFILLTFALVIIAGGEVINGLKLREHRVQEIAQDSVQLARIAELDMVRILEGSRQLLATLAWLPAGQGWDERACAVVEATAASDLQYDTINAVDRDGIIRCSSDGPQWIGTEMREKPLLARIVETAGFSVGTLGRGMVSGNEVVRVGYPVVSIDGAVTGAVYAAINVTWLNSAIEQWKIGDDVSIEIADRNGILVARHPDSRLVGEPLERELQDLVRSATSGSAEITGSDGRVRLYGYIPIDASPSNGLAVFVGRDRARIVADIDRAILGYTGIVMLGVVVAAVLAVAYVRRIVARPFRILLKVVECWRDGDWTARSNAHTGIPEFDRLSATFDRMAAEVSAREQKIKDLARSDALTGLPNRRSFVDALEQALARARRGDASFAVLYLDLDHFKDVNDILGHPVGDQLLLAVARRLQDSSRLVDTVARFGGDEFAVIAADIRQPTDAAAVADKLLNAIAEPFHVQDHEIRAGTSIGIDVYSPNTDAETLLSHADIALYRAKSEGRGTYRFFTEAMDTAVHSQVSRAALLHAAIEAGELTLYFRPRFNIDSRCMTGVDTVVRWEHPEHGPIEADGLFEIAEQAGLIVPLGHWVLQEACRQTRNWVDEGLDPKVVAIGVSGRQLKTAVQFERDIAAITSASCVSPSRLELELTETALMEVSREHDDMLARLRQSGFRFAVKDFGAGYSALGYLRKFPVAHIKIAPSPAEQLEAGSSYAAVVQATVGLALALGLRVVADGVPDGRRLEVLRAWGCQEAQGAYFAPPLRGEEVRNWLRGERAGQASTRREPADLVAVAGVECPVH